MSTGVELSVQATPFFTENQLEIAKAALVDACKATKSVRKRLGDCPIQYVEVPDHALRIVAATKVVEFGRGKAVATTVIANLGKPGANSDGDDLRRMIQNDPEALTAIEDTLKKWKATAEKTAQQRPLEITVTPAPKDGEKAGS
jgi:hypothetical protein